MAGRGAYYDRSGAMRDMVQNHLMQLLCLIAMEPPAKFEPDAVRDEKVKVIDALQPVEPAEIVRGQYRGGNGGQGYREHAGNPTAGPRASRRCRSVANWRWFFLRTQAAGARASDYRGGLPRPAAHDLSRHGRAARHSLIA